MGMGLGDISAQGGISLQTMGMGNLQAATAALTASAPGVVGVLQGAGAAGLMTQTGQKPLDMGAVNQAAEQFEAVFIGQMLEPMFEGIQTDPLFGGGHGEEMFRNLLINEYGKQMAAHGGLGLASSVKQELIRAQEKQQRGGGKAGSYGAAARRT